MRKGSNSIIDIVYATVIFDHGGLKTMSNDDKNIHLFSYDKDKVDIEVFKNGKYFGMSGWFAINRYSDRVVELSKTYDGLIKKLDEKLGAGKYKIGSVINKPN